MAFAEELKDIRGPVAIPGDLFWFWILLGLGPLVTLFLFILKYRKSVKPVVVPVRPPWEIALSAIEALAREDRDDEDQIKEFYSRLSEIVRHYLEQRFDIRAPEMTTEEFLEKSGSSPTLNDVQKKSLHGLLNASDLVKFAKTIPSASDMDDALQWARRFVTETTPPPPVEEGKSKA
jgi:hypothetical protein